MRSYHYHRENDQLPVRGVSTVSIMRTAAFARGVADKRSGRPPRYDDFMFDQDRGDQIGQGHDQRPLALRTRSAMGFAGAARYCRSRSTASSIRRRLPCTGPRPSRSTLYDKETQSPGARTRDDRRRDS